MGSGKIKSMGDPKFEHIIEVAYSSQLIIVKLTKSITFQNLSDVQKEFAEATKGRNIKNILFDLKEVSQTDSSGIAGLVDLLRYMKSQHNDGKVGLVNLSENMKALLAISKAESIFKIYLSTDDAIRDLG